MGMRAVVRTVAVVGVAGAVSLAGAGTAAAKGPTDVTIGVPGGVPVELSATDAGDSDLVMDLAEDLGVWEVTGDGQALVPEAPTAHLGPALRVEWTMYNAVPSNPAYAPRVVQTLYPLAAGGAHVHTAGGQRFFASDLTRGGWFLAPERLAADLAALGIESELVVPPPAADPAASRPAASGPAAPGRQGGWLGPTVAVVAAVLAAAVVASTMWRRPGRGAPAPAG
jgi:hypothetical protein